jgi:hypothetical protein
MYLGDPNITKKGLLALKDSKPVPITAHSHEIVVPCIYTETVKKLMKAKGIELPLTPAKLAEARKLAKATPGKYEPEHGEKAGGSSHARGTTNVTVNIKNVIPTAPTKVRHAKRGRRGGRSKIIMARASGLIPAPPPMKPGMVVNPNYNLIRPFVANTPIGYEPRPQPSKEEIKKELEHEHALEKRLHALEYIQKKADELREQEERHVKQQIVRPDDFVDSDREEAVAKKMQPSQVEIEDISESLPQVEQPERGPPREPYVAIQDMDRGPLLEKLRGYSKMEAHVRGFDKDVLHKIYRTITGNTLPKSQLKAAVVAAVINAINEAH